MDDWRSSAIPGEEDWRSSAIPGEEDMWMTGDLVQYQVNGQLHALDTFSIRRRPHYQFNKWLGGPQISLGVLEKRRICCTCWDSNLISSIFHPVA